MLKDYLVVDLEMTGLSAKRDSILEIGAVKVREKKVCESFSCLVRPNRKISEEIQELTGISNRLAARGCEADEAVREFLKFAEDLVWVGHNVIFDYGFISQWAANHRISLTKYAVDTLKLARKCLPELEKKSLDYLCEYFGIERARKHRAYEDAAATQALYEILEREFEEKLPDCFHPAELKYKAKRQTPATRRQKNYLNELAEYHKIELDVSVEHLSRSEASRLTDRIIRQYGRMGV